MQTIKEALDTIRKKLPFLITLTDEDRKKLYKTGAGRLSFVQDALAIAKNNPGILPGNFDVAEFESDVDLFAVMTELSTLFKQLFSQADDTRMAVGSEAIKGASQVNDYAKTGAKTTPGLKPVVSQLGKKFKKNSQKPPPPPESPAK